MYEFSKQNTVVLPNSVSPNAIITLIAGTCITTKRLSNDAAYIKSKANSASGSLLPISSLSNALIPILVTGCIKFNKVQNLLKPLLS